MLCFVLATSVLLVEARETPLVTTDDSLSFEDITVSSNDPWLPLVGDTEGAQSMTTGNYEPQAKVSYRRANNLVESLRKQLMRDNYDYMDKVSAENVTTTTVIKTINKSLRSMEVIKEKPSKVSSYYNQMLATKVMKEFAVVRAQPKTGLQLRRSNGPSNEYNEYGGSENIVEDEEIEKSTMSDIMRERHDIRRQDRILGRQIRRHDHKHKHRETEKERNLKGINKRVKQYGLQLKKQSHRMNYNIRTGQNGTQQNGAGDEIMEYEQIQSVDLYNSPLDKETDNRRSNQYGNQQNEQRNDNFNNRRSGQLGTEQNGQQVDAVDNRRTNFKDHHVDLQEKSNHDDRKDIQYDDQENTQRVKAHDKNHIVNKTDGNNRETEIKQELLTELQDKSFDHMDDQPFDKDKNTDPKRNVQHDEGQQEDINNGRRSNMQHYNQYVEETTSNVKYKLLKVQSLGSRSRRSGIGAPQHILQERGSEGVALISLDQAPFPQFRLPRARRQYMHETGNIRHPLLEQLPKANARSHDGRRRAT